jgi:phage I-like protein
MKPPKKFRIFKKGINSSTKGDILFDEQAAKDVMSQYAQHGVKVMIDLEHLSLDDTAPNYDPDARGWCKFEVIKGELWAVDVTWTPDGKDRLEGEKQRYISPAFARNKDTGRVSLVLNMALVAMPATNEAQDLLAASRFTILASRFPNEQIGTLTLKVDYMPPEILAMLGLTPEATAEDVAAAIKALLSKASATPPPAPAAGEDPKVAATILALTTRAQKGDAAIAELKAIKDAESATKRNQLLGKLPKALEAWGAKQSIETIEEYIKHAEPSEPEKEKAKSSGGNSEDIQLTEAELTVCKATGTKPADLLKFKRDNAAAGKAV